MYKTILEVVKVPDSVLCAYGQRLVRLRALPNDVPDI